MGAIRSNARNDGAFGASASGSLPREVHAVRACYRPRRHPQENLPMRCKPVRCRKFQLTDEGVPRGGSTDGCRFGGSARRNGCVPRRPPSSGSWRARSTCRSKDAARLALGVDHRRGTAGCQRACAAVALNVASAGRDTTGGSERRSDSNALDQAGGFVTFATQRPVRRSDARRRHQRQSASAGYLGSPDGRAEPDCLGCRW